MADSENFMIHLSVLYRNTQKFFDRAMEEYGIGWGQLLFLFFINENEGCTMQEVTRISEVDKGTTTKAISKLSEEGYVEVRQDTEDKRIRRVYTTEKAVSIMNTLYTLRSEYRNQVFRGMEDTDFESEMQQICERSRSLSSDHSSLRIARIQKFSLKAYPGKTACVVYLAGCNLKCPYCYEKDLVFVPENMQYVPEEEVLSYLEERKNELEGVVLTGGEPCLQESLLPFLRKIKEMGYSLRLETNGCYTQVLKQCIQEELVDQYVMDYKAGKRKMSFLTGIGSNSVQESLQLLKDSGVDYEVVTTLIREIHTHAEMEKMARELVDVKHYVLRNYEDRESVISRIYHPLSEKEMKDRWNTVRRYIPDVRIEKG